MLWAGDNEDTLDDDEGDWLGWNCCSRGELGKSRPDPMDRGGERMSGGERLLEVNPPGDAA